MAVICDDPAAFADDALDGFVAANGDHVLRVDGGVVRAAESRPGEVAVVIGGGSGHYPAFAGLVGVGLAAGAACGNVFSSPSAGQVYRVAKAAESGGGVLFSFGNYAGDVLHFGRAQAQLRSEGIDARTVLVTDDVASAPRDRLSERRGIAGDLTVFKVAGAAAELGLPLDDVERLARKANMWTRSLGVAFRGCTLPGATEPLFTVPAGRMAVGLGIHGEPGISEMPAPSASELAELLVSTLLTERPPDGGERVVVLVNGLGLVKYEELFLLFGKIRPLLAEGGLVVVDTECGELVTSLDMSGLSLTLFWVDGELEPLWLAPADTPAYHKGAVRGRARRGVAPVPSSAGPERETATGASQQLARVAAAAIEVATRALHQHERELGALDAVAGDGDHGAGMCRGADAAAEAARDALSDGAGVDWLVITAGEKWSERVGGTSGALWGAALTAMGSSLGNRETYTAGDLLTAMAAGRDAIVALGHASPGDKTMLDALVPLVQAFGEGTSRGLSLPRALQTAAEAATRAAQATAPLRPRKGRARPLADRSVGTPDPGAVSLALVVTALAEHAIATEGVPAGQPFSRGAAKEEP